MSSWMALSICKDPGGEGAGGGAGGRLTLLTRRLGVGQNGRILASGGDGGAGRDEVECEP